MKVIFSYINNYYKKNPYGDDFATKDKYDLQLAAVSNFYAKKFGFETIFFGNDESLNKYQNIKYSDFKLISLPIMDDLPEWFWVKSKLASLYLMNEPCIHVDMDLFIKNFIHKDLLSKDIICLHEQNFSNKVNKITESFLFVDPPSQCSNIPFQTYNCGILGGNDMETIKKSIDILFKHLILNKKNFNIYNTLIGQANYSKDHDATFLFEQVWLFQIFKSFGKEITNILHNINNWEIFHKNEMTHRGITHLLQDSKNLYKYKQQVTNTINKYNIKY